MKRTLGSYGSRWTFLQDPDPEMFGPESYGWSFLLKVDLPVLLGLLVLFALPPLQAWAGCDLRILAAGFAVHFGYAVALNLIGLEKMDPRRREFFSHLANVIAVVAIPLSSDRALFPLWALYPLIVWMDGYGSPKSVASLMTSLIVPWADPLWHWGSAAAPEKALLAGVSACVGLVIYLIASYFTSWSRSSMERRAHAETLEAALAERERIGRSLHGTLGAALSEITLWQEVALAGAATAGPSEPLARAQARAKAALTELRSLVAGMDDVAATMASLSEGVRRQAGGLCEAGGIAFEMTTEGEEPLDAATAYHGAKFALEAVTNAVRHGRARKVSVALSAAPLSIVVQDDGTGFDPAAPAGRGLRSLAEHAQALGGRLEIDSSRGRGTRVRLVPGASS